MPQSPLQIGASLKRLRASHAALIGRDQELATLRASIQARRSVFVTGPSGVGKTALLHAVYGEWDADRAGFPLFYCAESSTRRCIATHVLVNLLLNRGALRGEYIERRTTVASLSGLRHFVSRQRLPDLKRLMHQNLQGRPACLLLDHADHPDPKVAALLEVWLDSTPLVLVARDAASAGRARWLLSAFEHLEIAPLPAPGLQHLAHAIAAHHVVSLRDGDLRELVQRAAGNPGRLHALLRLAARPEYQGNGAVRWSVVDFHVRISAIIDRSQGWTARSRTPS